MSLLIARQGHGGRRHGWGVGNDDNRPVRRVKNADVTRDLKMNRVTRLSEQPERKQDHDDSENVDIFHRLPLYGYLYVLLNHPAVEQVNRSVRIAGVTRVVRDHADGGAAAMQLAQQIHHLLAILRIEISSRLIG